MKRLKRSLAFLLTAVLLAALVPSAALAWTGPDGQQLPPATQVSNGGFWVTLYQENQDGTAYEEVYTQCYDGTQNYISFSQPQEGGLLNTYTTTATVDGQAVLTAANLPGYTLADAATLTNEMLYDQASDAWVAEPMYPAFDQPERTVAKRGVAFLVEGEPAPALPQPGVTVLPVAEGGKLTVTYTCTNDSAVHPSGSQVTREYTQLEASFLKAAAPATLNNGTWTCQVTLDAAAMLQSVLTDDHTATDVTLAVVYDADAGAWKIPAGQTLTVSGTCDATGPAAPDATNCTDFYLTVYGSSTQSGSTVNTALTSQVWSQVGEGATVTFAAPVQNDQGVWTCTATVNAKALVDQTAEDHASDHYCVDSSEATTKTVTLTYDVATSQWTAPSDGITYGDATARNGVAFRLVDQGHITERRGAKEATCTEDGYTGDLVCTVCGQTIEQGETIPALGHKTELRGAKEATCTEDGYTGDLVCTVCGQTIETGKAIPATGHHFENGVCTVCGEEDPNYVPPTQEPELGVVIDNNTDNQITAGNAEDVFEDGTVVTIEDVASGDVYDTVEQALEGVVEDMDQVAILDISADLNGHEVQPDGKLRMVFEIPANLSADHLKMYIVDENGNRQEVPITVDLDANTVTANLDRMDTYVLANVISDQGGSNVPPTGDNANLTLWVVLAAVCAVILVAVVVVLNKKRTRH